MAYRPAPPPYSAPTPAVPARPPPPYSPPEPARRPPPPPYGAPGAVTLAREGGRPAVRDGIPELDREMKLSDEINRDEMERWADYYALIRTMERLELAFIRGRLDSKIYEKQCQHLLVRFAMLKETLPANMQNPAVSIPTFLSQYQITALAAVKRFSIGVPATVAQGAVEDTSKPKALFVAEAVQAYITVMDSLRLNMVAVDQIHPLVADIVNALAKIAMLPPDFEPRLKVKKWLEKLSSMRASDQLDEEETRQFLMELDSSHQQFVHWLSTF